MLPKFESFSDESFKLNKAASMVQYAVKKG
jgi:hypothetical protein